jgi:hypothetical protein
MVSRDWAEQHIHECIVGSPCGFCPALNLGLRAISLISARLDFPLTISLLAAARHCLLFAGISVSERSDEVAPEVGREPFPFGIGSTQVQLLDYQRQLVS